MQEFACTSYIKKWKKEVKNPMGKAMSEMFLIVKLQSEFQYAT